MSSMIWITHQPVAFTLLERHWPTLSAPGPVMRRLSSRTSIPCTRAPERLTPSAWPVVRNKYMTEHHRVHQLNVKGWRVGELTSSCNSHIRSRYSCDDRLGKPSVVTPAAGGRAHNQRGGNDRRQSQSTGNNIEPQLEVRRTLLVPKRDEHVCGKHENCRNNCQRPIFPGVSHDPRIMFSTGRKMWGIGKASPPCYYTTKGERYRVRKKMQTWSGGKPLWCP